MQLAALAAKRRPALLMLMSMMMRADQEPIWQLALQPAAGNCCVMQWTLPAFSTTSREFLTATTCADMAHGILCVQERAAQLKAVCKPSIWRILRS